MTLFSLNRRFPPHFRSLLPALAGTLIFLGERVFPVGFARPVLDGAGPVFLVVALGWVVLFPGSSPGSSESGWSERLTRAFPTGLFLLAALLYFFTLLLPDDRSGLVDWGALLGWGWVLAILVGVFPHLFIELSVFRRGEERPADPARVRRAAAAGFSLGLLLALIVTLNFIFTRVPWQWDLAYFKTSEPSTATLDIARNLEEPVQAVLFYPEGNIVLSLLMSYFDGLPTAPGKLAVHTYDAELKPLEATAFKARRNGVVVLRKGTFTKSIQVGLEMRRARKNLKKFDQSFFSALVEVSSEKRIAYLTVGHGERNEKGSGPGRKNSARSGMKNLRSLLEERNFEPKPLGALEGLGREIPRDAALLLIVAPRIAFLPGEVAAVRDFLQEGGRLLIFMDPEDREEAVGAKPPGPKEGLRGLLAEYGMILRPVIFANDRFYARRTFTKADHSLLVTIGFTSHPAVKALRSKAKQNPLLLLGSGGWRRGKAPRGMRVQEVLKGMTGTWADKNRNFIHDPKSEKRETPTLALALSPRSQKGVNGVKQGPGPTVMAFADADLATDFLTQNKANRLMLSEAIRWVAGSDLPEGLANTEEDTRIRHVKEDELVWFYLPVFAVPLLVLLLGYFLSGRPAIGRRS